MEVFSRSNIVSVSPILIPYFSLQDILVEIVKRENDWNYLSMLKGLLGDDRTKEDKADGSGQSGTLDQNLVKGHQYICTKCTMYLE